VGRGWKQPEGDGKWVRKVGQSLFIKRPLLNAADLVAWAKEQGFETALQPGDMHVTVLYSKAVVEWPEPLEDEVVVNYSAARTVEALGNKGAVVLGFEAPELERRWQDLVDAGASHDFDGYKAHVTITWRAGDLDLAAVEPFQGDLVFGPERMREIDPDWSPDTLTEKFYKADVAKVDAELGLVFGWAIVCKVDAEPFFDSQGDHIPEESMLLAASDFMEHSRVAKEMHDGEQVGDFVFAFPLTSEVAKAMDITTKYTGLMVAMKPSSPAVLEKFRDGTYTGFSIGGSRVKDEDVD
jgi:hypothetical protein